MPDFARQPRTLVVDDTSSVLRILCRLLEHFGHEVTPASCGAEALAELERTGFDLVVTDLRMDDVDGITVLRAAKARDPLTAVIILTGHGDFDSAVTALRHDADDFMTKPANTEELAFRIGRCLEKRDLAQRVSAYETILPICASCRKIRDDRPVEQGGGGWTTPEEYLLRTTAVQLSHGLCPTCRKRDFGGDDPES